MISVSFWPFIFHLRGSSSPQTHTPTKTFPIKWITLVVCWYKLISAPSRSLVCPSLIFRPCTQEAVVHWKILLLMTLCSGVTLFFFFFFFFSTKRLWVPGAEWAHGLWLPLALLGLCRVLFCGTVRPNWACLRKEAFYFKTSCILNASSLNVASITRFRYE